MKRTVLPLLAAAGALLAPPAGAEAAAKPLLWRIERQPPSYLFGTIHVPDRRVLDRPRAVREAFSRCDTVVTEVPLDPSLRSRLLPRLLLAEGKTLADVLPPDLYQRVDGLLRARGLGIAAFSRFQPWALASQLELLDDLGGGRVPEPLDQIIYREAQQAGKRVEGLETIDEQLAIFSDLTLDEQVAYLEATVKEIEEHPDATRRLVDLYLAGDPEALLRAIEEALPKETALAAKLRRSLIDDRNRRMAERIAARLRNDPGRSFCFAVGAGHFAGKGGLLQRLRREGLPIERVQP